jgi:hypothetical protein
LVARATLALAAAYLAAATVVLRNLFFCPIPTPDDRNCAVRCRYFIRGCLGRFKRQNSRDGSEVRTLLALVADLIMAERECCPFLAFHLTAEAKMGPLTIRMTDMDGAKEFLKSILVRAYTKA